MTRCDDIQPHLTAYLFGELSPRDEGDVCHHLEHCESCQTEFLVLQESLAALQEEAGSAPEVRPLGHERRQALFTHLSQVQKGAGSAPVKAARGWTLWRPGMVLKLAAALAVAGAVWVIVAPLVTGPVGDTVYETDQPVTTREAIEADSGYLEEAAPEEAAAQTRPAAKPMKKAAPSELEDLDLAENLERDGLTDDALDAAPPTMGKGDRKLTDETMTNQAVPLDRDQVTGPDVEAPTAHQPQPSAAPPPVVLEEPLRSLPKGGRGTTSEAKSAEEVVVEEQQDNAEREPFREQRAVQALTQEFAKARPPEAQVLPGPAEALQHRLTLTFADPEPTREKLALQGRSRQEASSLEPVLPQAGQQLIKSPLRPGAYVLVLEVSVPEPGRLTVTTDFDPRQIARQRLLQLVPPEALRATLVYEIVPIGALQAPGVLRLQRNGGVSQLDLSGDFIRWEQAPGELQNRILSAYLNGGQPGVRAEAEALLDAAPDQ